MQQQLFRKRGRSRNISYGTNEDYIWDIEEEMLKKYKIGPSRLHKSLILKFKQMTNTNLMYP